MTAKEKAVGKRTRASVKADVVAPNENKWWGHCIYVEDGLHQVFREDFLLDLEVRLWCGDIEHDKPGYFLFHGMLRIRIRCLALR
jgi:hypothetical protein